MTREQKLALIIGFSLVMVVGVLISDHFSRARTDPLGSAVDPDGGGGSRIDPISLVEEEPPLDEVWVRDPLPSRTPSPTPAAHPAAEAPTAIVMGEPPAQHPLPASQEGYLPTIPGPALSQQTPSSPAMLPQTRPETGPPVTIADPLSGMFEPVYPEDAAVRAARAIPEPQPTLANERTHTVGEDESLWKIAERHYGDGAKWTRIRDRNPTLVDENGFVQAGVKLAIPLEKPAAAPPAAEPKRTEPTRPEKAKPRTYVVKKGDNLGEIAQRELGSAKRWPEIVKLNDIEDPDHVPAGVTLRLPS